MTTLVVGIIAFIIPLAAGSLGARYFAIMLFPSGACTFNRRLSYSIL